MSYSHLGTVYTKTDFTEPLCISTKLAFLPKSHKLKPHTCENRLQGEKVWKHHHVWLHVIAKNDDVTGTPPTASQTAVRRRWLLITTAHDNNDGQQICVAVTRIQKMVNLKKKKIPFSLRRKLISFTKLNSGSYSPRICIRRRPWAIAPSSSNKSDEMWSKILSFF